MQINRWIGTALVLLGLGTVAGWADPIEKPTRTELSREPWIPSPAAPQPKVIYGTDDRIDVYEETNPDRLDWAASTCGLFFNSDVQENGNGTVTLRTSSYGVCSDEPFATQPTSAFCSGFMVGDDIIVTAGHCFDASDLGRVQFVFGFVMEDENTPVLTLPSSQVYTGVELLGQALAGDLDYAVVRVDRTITAAGATPFEIRREGVIPVGAQVGVIGHPSGLPMKIAFGANTLVRSNTIPGFFVANLDTYGGNSGSPVINPSTGIVEGILVRGEKDFITDGSCRRSNVVSNTGGRGEDVSKTLSFMQFVPEIVSFVRFDQDFYGCEGTITISLLDMDLAGMGAALVDVMTDGGDLETVSLAETGVAGRFEGTLPIGEGVVFLGSGTLEIDTQSVITVAYDDLIHGPESPNVLIDTAAIDCVSPTISDVHVVQTATRAASVRFTTDEMATGLVRFGTSCDTPSNQANSIMGTDHEIILQSLTPGTTYYFFVQAEDEGGNEGFADNGGSCFSFTTAARTDYYTESFVSGSPDLTNTSITFTPTEVTGVYDVCRSPVTDLFQNVSGATPLGLADDGTAAFNLEDAAEFPFFGRRYATLYVNANGNITFKEGDSTFDPSVTDHFEIRRISPCYTDLNPSSGEVYFDQRSDSAVITWLDVPYFGVDSANTFQVELFFDGTVRMTYLNIAVNDAIVGLSNGLGLQSDFSPMDLSIQESCDPNAIRYHRADSDQDESINLQELLRVIQFVNLKGYHCDVTGEDGYAPGQGKQDCGPHDSDYGPQDWSISLTEILRLVQFFNVGGYAYRPEDGTEDGFVPVSE